MISQGMCAPCHTEVVKITANLSEDGYISPCH